MEENLEKFKQRKNALSQVEEQLEFLRPSNEKDIKYRLRQYNEFSNEQIKNIEEVRTWLKSLLTQE